MLAFLGMTTLPGMLITDWYAAGIGHEFGLEGTLAVEEHMQDTMWGIAGFGLAGASSGPLSVPAADHDRAVAGGPDALVVGGRGGRRLRGAS